MNPESELTARCRAAAVRDELRRRAVAAAWAIAGCLIAALFAALLIARACAGGAAPW